MEGDGALVADFLGVVAFLEAASFLKVEVFFFFEEALVGLLDEEATETGCQLSSSTSESLSTYESLST